MKQIELSQDKYAIVDDNMFEYLNQWKWTATHKDKRWYAVRQEGGRIFHTRYYMHSVIMNSSQGMEVDHINKDGLDNRRENLRIATRTENNQNRDKNKNNTSGYKGVSWNNEKGKYRAYIVANYKQIFLGNFKNIEDAAVAYDKAAIEYFGQFASLNFKEK
jgi:hypothetical protein